MALWRLPCAHRRCLYGNVRVFGYHLIDLDFSFRDVFAILMLLRAGPANCNLIDCRVA